MALSTINLNHGFVSNDLISEQPNPSALAKIASPIAIDMVDRDTQIINFEGEMGLFDDESPDAAPEEKVKASNTATNTKMTTHTHVFQYSQRFSKRFLQVFEGNGYNLGDRIGGGLSLGNFADLLKNPYQAKVLNQFQAAVNAAAGRALDYAAIFGVNPQTMKASTVARTNGFLLDKAKAMLWTPPSAKGTAGNTAASDILKNTVQDISTQADYQSQGAMTADYLFNLSREVTTSGTPAGFAGNLPLTATDVTVGGVPFAVAPTIANAKGAAAAGVKGNTLDAVLGNFNNRFRFGVMSLGDGIEVFDVGNPDGGATDLANKNEILLRVEIGISWGFLGGTDKFRYIAHK